MVIPGLGANDTRTTNGLTQLSGAGAMNQTVAFSVSPIWMGSSTPDTANPLFESPVAGAATQALHDIVGNAQLSNLISASASGSLHSMRAEVVASTQGDGTVSVNSAPSKTKPTSPSQRPTANLTEAVEPRSRRP